MNTGDNVMTELAITVDFDGKEIDIPTVIPTLTKKELDHLLSGGKPTKEIIDKAIKHAIQRRKQGKSPFIEEDENEIKRPIR